MKPWRMARVSNGWARTKHDRIARGRISRVNGNNDLGSGEIAEQRFYLVLLVAAECIFVAASAASWELPNSQDQRRRTD